MRRFDKKQVIKESNELLEKKYLISKNYILEQAEEPDLTITTSPDVPMDNTTAVTTKTKEKVSTPKEDFELFKKELNTKGVSPLEDVVINNSNGKTIDIDDTGKYTIKSSEDDELQTGTFKSKGVGPAKHIELTPKDKPNIEYKLKNILTDIDKNLSEITPLNFYDTLKTIVLKPKNLVAITGGYRYTYYVNIKNNITTYYVVDFTGESYGTGKFKIGYLTSGQGGKWITNSDGTFTKLGKVLTLTSPKQVFSVDKKGKIDAALMSITGIIKPEFKN